MNLLYKNTGQLFSFIGKQFLSGTASHLWFVYIIVSLYLSFPLLSKWTKVAVKKEYIYFLSIWIIALLLDDYLAEYDTSWDLSYFSGYLGYIILGNYLFKVHPKIKGLILVPILTRRGRCPIVGLACAAGGWSGRPDSNRRHRPWQGRTLPTELLPRDGERVAPFGGSSILAGWG